MSAQRPITKFPVNKIDRNTNADRPAAHLPKERKIRRIIAGDKPRKLELAFDRRRHSPHRRRVEPIQDGEPTVEISHDNPNKSYIPLTVESQGSKVIAAYHIQRPDRRVCFKGTCYNRSQIHSLKRTDHKNVLAIQECFELNANIVCVYEEHMILTLGELCASPVRLDEPSLALVSHEVSERGNSSPRKLNLPFQTLEALVYIQEQFQRPYMNIDRDHILLSLEGKLKLADIIDVMASPPGNPSAPAKMLGHLLRQIMDGESGIQESQDLKIHRNKLWSEHIQKFLIATQSQSCSELLTVRVACILLLDKAEEYRLHLLKKCILGNAF